MSSLKEFVDNMQVEDAFYPNKVCMGKLVRNHVDDSVYEQGFFEVKSLPDRIKDMLDDNGSLEIIYPEYTYSVHAYGEVEKPLYYYGTKVATRDY